MYKSYHIKKMKRAYQTMLNMVIPGMVDMYASIEDEREKQRIVKMIGATYNMVDESFILVSMMEEQCETTKRMEEKMEEMMELLKAKTQA